MSMSVNVMIQDDDHMIVKNNKKSGIKDTAIVLTVILIIFMITTVKAEKYTMLLVIFFIAIFAFVFLLNVIDYALQCKTFLEVSGENLLLRKYGKKTIKITSDAITKVCFGSYNIGENTSDFYVLRIHYGKNKHYNLPLDEPLEINKMEGFFLQYCGKRNIQLVDN